MCAALGVDPLAAAVEGAKAKAAAGERATGVGGGGGTGEDREDGEEKKGKDKGIAGLKGLFWERVGKGFGKGVSAGYVLSFVLYSHYLSSLQTKFYFRI